ncbi:MerR family transcriptional regulator [Promicromonospora iranensis]|uniref:DNA-binding transcriptional MerR regulator n=1 Tax=Promicromonospora iranensis TaxID=1105144 RepID=A0ABU2CNE9_9MICO|nr:MerR family transcriptional regulator [Promicromonospora iranensis]MDR7382868.1 DNA-binding transcriptional MerR regulator [Promicromonospora iranensis]
MDGMKISELSARSGVSTSALRYYEAEGLLPAGRSSNGYRVYGPAAVGRLAFIAQAKQLGLPLAAVRELADAWESEPCQSVRARYRPMLVERAVEVAERERGLEDLRSALATAVGRLDALPDRDEPCDSCCSDLDHPGPSLPMAGAAPGPIACTLGSGDYSARVEEWRELLAGAPRVDVEGGVRATLPTSALDRATGLAVAEQTCCAFYAIRFDLHGSTFDLTLTAPPGAGSMLADLLPEAAGSAR